MLSKKENRFSLLQCVVLQLFHNKAPLVDTRGQELLSFERMQKQMQEKFEGKRKSRIMTWPGQPTLRTLLDVDFQSKLLLGNSSKVFSAHTLCISDFAAYFELQRQSDK